MLVVILFLIFISFLIFILLFFFICQCSSFTFAFRLILHPYVDYRRFFTPILYFQPSPSQSDSQYFHFQPFRYVLTTSATVFNGHFLSPSVFYLMLLPDIFGTTCYYQGLPGSRQLFLEVFGASYWSSNHRPSPSVFLIHSNSQSFIHFKFVFLHVNIAKVWLVVKTLIKNIFFCFSFW